MTQTVFDAGRFVEFDLSKGAIFAAGSEPSQLIPSKVLAALLPGDGLEDAAREWGRGHGERLAETLGDEVETAGMEVLANHLGGTAAVLGLGTVSLEVRGDLLLIRIDVPGAGCTQLYTGFVEGYLAALFTNPFEALVVEQAQEGMLLWVGSPSAVASARDRMSQGESPLAAIERLVERSH